MFVKMAKCSKNFIEEVRKPVLSFPSGKDVMKIVDELPKSKKCKFAREFDKKGVCPLLALKRAL